MYFLPLFFAELLLLFLLSRSLNYSLTKVLYRISHSRSFTVFAMAVLFLPGTALHEISHVFMAEILRVPTGDIDLIPKIEEKGIRMGSVPVAEVDPFRMFAIGAAPFIFGVLLIALTIAFLNRVELLSILWVKVLAGYIIFEVSNTMYSSRKDMEGAIELFVVIAIVGALLYFAGLSLPSFNFTGFLESHASSFELGAKLMAIPLAIDVGAILFLGVIYGIIKPRR